MRVWLLVGFVAVALAQFDRSASEYPIEGASQPPIVESKLFKVVKNADGVKRADLPSVNLVVGIMSSPSHFEERNAVRSSWLQLLSLTDPKLNNLSLKDKQNNIIRFIIGDQSDPQVEDSIANEVKTFHDIVRVPVTESYFNLTLKTSEFFKWAQATYDFKWLMKCDDDSFVRVDLLLQDLLHRATERLYMGKIWIGTPVDRRIDAQTPWKQYPPFAAGAGYVLSADLVSYVTRNLEDLFVYPLEDVAVGSWIAALKVNYVDHPHFHSLPEGCDRDMIVQNPANISVMKETFFHVVQGIPCHAKPDPFRPETKNVTDHVMLELGIPKPASAEEDTMQHAGVQAMLVTEGPVVGDEEEADAGDDGMSSSMMNGNSPSMEALQNMNRGALGAETGDSLEQSSEAALDRMNGAASVDANELA